MGAHPIGASRWLKTVCPNPRVGGLFALRPTHLGSEVYPTKNKKSELKMNAIRSVFKLKAAHR
jgi:hypothetical protein